MIDVKIEDIYNSKTKKAGYIEFTYNGLNYETVSVNVKEENTNKVAEISSNSQNLVDKSIDGTYLDNRTSFNESWAVIENNKKIDTEMSKICQITGKKAMVGNNVSHSKRRTKRRFNVNLFTKKFYWVEQDCWINLRISAAGLRTINKVGLDAALKQAASKGYLNA